MGGDGGIHARVVPTIRNSFLIEFFDSNGVNIDKNTERKIENLFFREDFRRTAMDDVGQSRFPSRSLELYTSEFLQALNPHALPDGEVSGRRRLRYGNAVDRPSADSLEPRRRLVALDAYFDEAKARTFRETASAISNSCGPSRLTLGAISASWSTTTANRSR